MRKLTDREHLGRRICEVDDRLLQHHVVFQEMTQEHFQHFEQDCMSNLPGRPPPAILQFGHLPSQTPAVPETEKYVSKWCLK